MKWDYGIYLLLFWFWSSFVFAFGWICCLMFQRWKAENQGNPDARFRRASPTDRLSR